MTADWAKLPYELLAAIAKSGGLSRDEAKRQGIDPVYFNVKGHGIYRVFTKNGQTADDLAHNTLAPWGYPVTGANDLIEAIQKELTKLDHPEVKIRILQATVGGVTEADVQMSIDADAMQAIGVRRSR